MAEAAMAWTTPGSGSLYGAGGLAALAEQDEAGYGVGGAHPHSHYASAAVAPLGGGAAPGDDWLGSASAGGGTLASPLLARKNSGGASTLPDAEWLTGAEYTVMVRPVQPPAPGGGEGAAAGGLEELGGGLGMTASGAIVPVPPGQAGTPRTWRWLRPDFWSGGKGERPGREGEVESAEVYISCCDGVGLGCELARVIYEFGLSVTGGDFSTDGRFCFLMFKVAPQDVVGELVGAKANLRPDWWRILESQLIVTCPKDSFWTGHDRMNWYLSELQARKYYVLEVDASQDRVGLLLTILTIIWFHQFTVLRIECSDTGPGRVKDKFQLTDNLNEGVEHMQQLCRMVEATLGATCSFYPLQAKTSKQSRVSQIRGMSKRDSATWTNLNSVHQKRVIDGVSRELLDYVDATNNSEETVGSEEELSIEVDNMTSRSHTALHIMCKERKGLFYDSMRALKDLELQASYGRIEAVEDLCHMTMFIQNAYGDKIEDPETLRKMESLFKNNIVKPFHIHMSDVTLENDEGGEPMVKLEIVTRVDGNGRGRPRVLLDTTKALTALDLFVRRVNLSVAPISQQDPILYSVDDNVRDFLEDNERKVALLERHCFYITQPDGDYIDEAARVKIREEVRTTLIGFAEKPKAKRSLGFAGADGAFDGARQPGGCCGCAVQ